MVRRSSVGNRNADWVEGKGSWIAYIGLVLGFRVAMAPFFSPENGWVITTCWHNFVTFFLFHWNKGSPIPEDDAKYAKYTWWEQLEGGEQFTPTKKFLSVVPVVLLLFSLHYCDYELVASMFMVLSFCFVFFPKLPEMHKVRLFGINK
eukprot:GFYU01006265.1.p1 GENE.GFYU01006265.1~~GFYU01006265.1.p1  ORF type:complete len:148 (+),score=40.54 GFYU01006265.1:193-636(+)